MSEQKTVTELFNGDPAPKNTRERLINTSLDLFYEHGFHAVGLDQILGAVGVTKTTFYNHFDSKENLILAAIRKRDEWEFSTFTQRVRDRSDGDPRRMLVAMFDMLDELFNHPDFVGCLFLNACSEFPSPHDPIHQAAAAHYRRVSEAVADMAREAGAKDPEALSKKLLLLMQGAMIVRQVASDNTAAAQAREVAERVMHEQFAEMRQ